MRKILAIILLLRCVDASAATAQKLFNPYSAQVSTSAVRYIPIMGTTAVNGTETSAFCIAPSNGTLTNLYVSVDAAPDTGGGTQSYTFQTRLNIANDNLTCTISEAATTCNDTTHTTTLAAGDRIAISVTPTNTPTAARVSTILQFNPTTSGETIFCGNSQSSPTANDFGSLLGVSLINTATEAFRRIVMPTSGTFKNLYVRQETASGVGTSRTLTLRQNAASTALAVTFTDAESGNRSDTSDTVTVTGTITNTTADTYDFQVTASGSPASSVYAWGIVFVPTTAGDFVIPAVSSANLGTGAANYVSQSAGAPFTPNATEAQVSNIGFSDYTVTAMYVILAGTAGGGKSYTFDQRAGGGNASTTFEVAISGGTDTAGSATGTFTPSDNVLYDTQSTPAGTPSGRNVSISYLGHMVPTGVSICGGGMMLGAGC